MNPMYFAVHICSGLIEMDNITACKQLPDRLQYRTNIMSAL